MSSLVVGQIYGPPGEAANSRSFHSEHDCDLSVRRHRCPHEGVILRWAVVAENDADSRRAWTRPARVPGVWDDVGPAESEALRESDKFHTIEVDRTLTGVLDDEWPADRA